MILLNKINQQIKKYYHLKILKRRYFRLGKCLKCGSCCENIYIRHNGQVIKNKEEFDKAWKHHYTNNLHHWNWWYESGNTDSMPFVHVIEMICDWEAMGYVFGNTSKQYYEENKHKIMLGEKQRRFAESLMDLICQ